MGPWVTDKKGALQMLTKVNMKGKGHFDLDSALQWLLILTAKWRCNCTLVKLQAYSRCHGQALDMVATRLGFRMHYQPEHTESLDSLPPAFRSCSDTMVLIRAPWLVCISSGHNHASIQSWSSNPGSFSGQSPHLKEKTEPQELMTQNARSPSPDSAAQHLGYC